MYKTLLTGIAIMLLASCTKQPYTFQDALADQITLRGYRSVSVSKDFDKCCDQPLGAPFTATYQGKTVIGCACGQNIYDFTITTQQ